MNKVPNDVLGFKANIGCCGSILLSIFFIASRKDICELVPHMT